MLVIDIILLYNLQLSSETLGDFVAKFSEIVALSTNSVVDQNKENLKLIAQIFEKVVDFIIQFDVMIGESEIITKIVETVNSLFQWTPSVIEAASSSRYI